MSVPVESVSMNQGREATGMSCSSGILYGDTAHARVMRAGSVAFFSSMDLCHVVVSGSADMSMIPSELFLKRIDSVASMESLLRMFARG